MPRMARIVVPGLAHPVTQRGTNRQIVFYSRRDRQESRRDYFARALRMSRSRARRRSAARTCASSMPK